MRNSTSSPLWPEAVGPSAFGQDYIKKLEQDRLESDLKEAHDVLAQMGNRLTALERNPSVTWSHSMGELSGYCEVGNEAPFFILFA